MKFLNNLDLTKTVVLEFTASDNTTRKLYWDEQAGTLSLEMGNGVIQQIGQEQYYRVKNTTGSIIPNGTLLMATGSVGESGEIQVAPAIADGSVSAEFIIGIATNEMQVGANGLATTFGLIHGINTTGSDVSETWLAGDKLYASSTVAGKLTKTAPYMAVFSAVVMFADTTNGTLLVKIDNGSYLNEAHDVLLTNLQQNDILVYSGTNWENIALNSLRFAASNIDLSGTKYPVGTDAQEAFDLTADDLATKQTRLLNTMSTGVTSSGGITINGTDNTKFDIGPITGYILDNETDPDNPTIIKISYAGATAVTPQYLLTATQTTIYITADGQLYQTAETAGTSQSRRQRLIIGRIIHTDNTVIRAIENWPIVAISPNQQLSDLWRAMGPINENVFVYPNGANLNLSLNGGGLHYRGINFHLDKWNPTRKEIPSQTVLTFGYRTKTGTTVADVTLVDPINYDLNGVITAIPAAPQNSTNQRVYLTRSGQIRIQYGQTVYSTLANAISAVGTEQFTVAPTLASNAMLIGVISLERQTTALNSATARFTPASKFGEIAGGGGGGVGGAVNAVNVAVTDAADYYTSSNAEGILQEIGYTLNNLPAAATSSVVAGTAIDVSSEIVGINTVYTVSHEDTSTLSGQQGSTGISSITVDGMGHVTAVGTASYLTSYTESNDFGKVLVTDNDTGYIWAGSGTATADTLQDQLTIVSGTGINIDIDTSADAIKIINTGVTAINGYSGQVSDQNIFDTVKGLDGTGSGLDADLLDGQHASDFALASHGTHVTYGTGTTTITPDSSVSHGSSTDVSRTDHTHAITTAAAVGLSNTTTNTEGTATSFARADHTHAITGFDNYQSWTISDGVNSEAITSGNTLTITGDGLTTTLYNPTLNTLTVNTDVNWADIGNIPNHTYTLSGDITGSYNVSGLADVNILTTIAADAVELGYNTNGDYVKTISAGNGIIVSSDILEGGTYTVSHADTSTATNITTINGDGNVIQNITSQVDTYGHVTSQSVTSINLDNRYYTETEVDTTLTNYQLKSEKGQANGYASLGSDGKIPTGQLPSYVDDVLEYANLAAFPATGEAGKIYVALDTNKTYRWSGSTYIYITSGAVDSVAGKTGIVTLDKSDVGLSNVDNTADVNKSVASAAKLTTARTINGVSFDGTANITITDSTKQPLDADLTAIAALTGGTGLLRKTAENTWSLDTSAVGGTVTQISTSGAITGGPITTSGTINHLTTSGYKHIPSGGSSGQALLWSSDGTAAWGTVSTVDTKYSLDGTGATNSATVQLIGTDSTTDSIEFVGGSGITSSWSETEQKITHALATAYGDTINPYGSKTANYVLAAPNGSAGNPIFRALVAADLPSHNHIATQITITDTGNYFTGTEVETALQETGSLLSNALYATNAVTGDPVPINADTLDGKHASDLEAFSIAMAIALS